MPFYFPLRLGQRRRKYVSPRLDSPSVLSKRTEVEVVRWREERNRLEIDIDELPEAQVLEGFRWASSGQSHRFWVILGEPGAGKSKLLDAWFERLVPPENELRLGIRIPALVRLREIDSKELSGTPEEVAVHLWQHAIRCSALLPHTRSDIFKTGRGPFFTPIWLLDGMDEIETLSHGEALFQKIAALPGIKVVSCRTAVFERYRRSAEPYIHRAYEVLGLSSNEQLSFLTSVLDRDRAVLMYKAISGAPSIRSMSSNPLMLTLLAEQESIRIPESRAAFYSEAVREMWSRKLGAAEGERFAAHRETVLVQLALSMKLDVESIESSLNLLSSTSRAAALRESDKLQELLEKSGILRLDRRREMFSFAHLTFQEYYFSSALLFGGLRDALSKYWADARYEEALSLLISQLYERQQLADIEKGILWLIDHASASTRLNRAEGDRPRSPLRVCLHLLRRSGIPVSRDQAIGEALLQKVNSSEARRLAVASDPECPAFILASLAEGKGEDVQRAVASNPSTPSSALMSQRNSPFNEVQRVVVARAESDALELLHLNTMLTTQVIEGGVSNLRKVLVAENLERLNSTERRRIASNIHSSAEILVTLARDEVDWVRLGVAANVNAPVLAKRMLAKDCNPDVRFEVASNSSSPADVLVQLAGDPSVRVRRALAVNPSTPALVLSELIEDNDSFVSIESACNPATPVEALLRLVLPRDDGIEKRNRGLEGTLPRVKKAVARNSSSPAFLLLQLVGDIDPETRRLTAFNPNCSETVLDALSSDVHPEVRSAVAQHLNCGRETLARLAIDPKDIVRRDVALNPMTPQACLVRLSKDHSSAVRYAAAQNRMAILEEF